MISSNYGLLNLKKSAFTELKLKKLCSDLFKIDGNSLVSFCNWLLAQSTIKNQK
jgi:hypothetical protein